MSLYDFRTKQASSWTYYVVDDLPTMANIYRFDTVEEAISKFKEMPNTVTCAIGSSFVGRNEIDHIHRALDGSEILVTDCDRTSNPIWRTSEEIQNAIDRMIAELKVEYQYDPDIFGRNYPAAAIPLERYAPKSIDPYFQNRILFPDDPKQLLSAITEVYVVGEGWEKTDSFLKRLDNSRPQKIGDRRPRVFVDRLCVKYIKEDGQLGEADVSPREFKVIRAQTMERTAPQELAAHLAKLAKEYPSTGYFDIEKIMETNGGSLADSIASDGLDKYQLYLASILKSPDISFETQKVARTLQSTFLSLMPKDQRRSAVRMALDDRILAAVKKHDQHIPNTSELQMGKEYSVPGRF